MRISRSIFAELAAVLFLVWSAAASPGYPGDTLDMFGAEPEPFRQDEVDPRDDFEYSNEAFLHRFSYRIRTDWQRQWDGPREGFIITAGSTRTDELFVMHLLRKTIQLDETFFAVIRHQREEDFDTRYDRLLTGLGAKIYGGWAIALLGDVVAEKEDIDPQLELTWEAPGGGSRFRAAVVATDTFFNRKNDEDSEYHEQPFTYFIEGKWQAREDLLLSAWFNWNSELELEYGDGSRFRYEQFMHEATALWSATAGWRLLASVGNQYGERELRRPAETEREHFDRRNTVLTLESEVDLADDLKTYHGFHYFFLEEEGQYHEILPEDGDELRRSEYMLYGGVIWALDAKFTLSPGVYLDFIDNRDPQSGDDKRGLIGKATLPVEYAFSPRARLAANPTVELHKANFGGFNLQFLILF